MAPFIREFARSHRLALGAALGAFVIYCGFSGGMLLRQSPAPHFVWQAAGFIQGSLAVPGEPPNLNDWVRRGDSWYVSFPPFPAVLMAPFVALQGLAFNDVFFTVCLAAVAVGLLAMLLVRLRADGDHQLADREIAFFVACFGVGSVFFPAAIRGEVWFTAHVVAASLTCLYIMASLRLRSPWLAGLAFGLAATTRASLVYAFPFFLVEALAPDGRVPPVSEMGARVRAAFPALVRFALPAAVVLGLAFAMNYVRFGSFTEFGHSLLHANRVNDRVARWGLFHPHYFVDNFRSAFLLLPTLSVKPIRLGFDGNGMSMLLTTPLLMFLPFAASRARVTLALAATAALVALPGLFYMNNGWFQFGFRFSNDYLPYLFALLVVGGRPVTRMTVVAGLLGVAVCTWGALVFNRFA